MLSKVGTTKLNSNITNACVYEINFLKTKIMGAIKLPKKSIKFFKNNQDKIFKSGALSEGIWNKKLSRKIKLITKSKNAIGVNSNGSGLVALLLIYKEYYGRTDIMISDQRCGFVSAFALLKHQKLCLVVTIKVWYDSLQYVDKVVCCSNGHGCLRRI